MNSVRFTYLTDSQKFVERLENENVPIIEVRDDVYETIVATCFESALYDCVHKTVTETKATVAVHVFYQDPGTGEADHGWLMYYNGKEVK